MESLIKYMVKGRGWSSWNNSLSNLYFIGDIVYCLLIEKGYKEFVYLRFEWHLLKVKKCFYYYVTGFACCFDSNRH